MMTGMGVPRECRAGFLILGLLLVLGAFCVNPSMAALDSWKVVVQKAGVSAMHMTTMHTDKVVIYDRTNFGKSAINLPNGKCRNNPLELVLKHDCTAHSVEYDSLTNAIRPLMIQTDPFCSSGAFLPDGTLQQTGGDHEGQRVTRTIGAGPTDDWKETNNGLFVRRWYAADQILPDGRVIVVGGTRQPSYEFVPRSTNNVVPFALLTKAFDKTSENNLYPFVHLIPDGNLFVFSNIYSVLFNYKTNTVVKTFPTFGPDPRVYPYSGTSVMLPLSAANGFAKVEIMICGGAPLGAYMQARLRHYLPALNTCGRIEITAAVPKWAVERMPSPRVMCDGMILPTGEILIINGGQAGVSGWNMNRNPAFSPFLYDTVAHKFTVQSPTTIPRMYHSSANVQSDGTVLVAGSNDQGGYVFSGVRFPTELRIEKYSPYYLNAVFDRHRFTLKNVPTTVQLNTIFVVTIGSPTPAAPTAVQISVYAPSFTTHANSMNQRMLILNVGANITAASGGFWQVTVTAPPNRNVAPPGWYMLTALNTAVAPAIPSKAKWVKLF